MNRIFPEQLASNLNSHLAKVYFLVGTDPLLLSESEDLIHQAALLQGFDEKNQITIDTNTDWSALIETSQSMGLFFNKQIFILNLPENLTALLQKNLQQFISGLNEDSLLVLALPKLSKAAEKQEWFIQANQLDPQAVIVNCQTPNSEQLSRWVKHRTRNMGLSADEEAIQQVLQMVTEGQVNAIDGSLVPVKAESICLHGDNQHSLQFAARIVEELEKNHITITA